MLTEKLGFGDGGLISTIDDLNDWSEALKKGKILSESSRKEMLRSALLEDGSVVWPEGMALRGSGAGVFLSGYDGHRVEKHSGGWADASAQLTRFLDDDLTVVVLTNVGDWAERPWIGEEIGSLFIGGYKLPEWTPTETVQSKATSEVAEMIKLIQQKKPVSSGLARDLATELSLNPAQFVPLVKGVDTTKLRFIRRVPQGKHPIDLYLSEGKVPMVVTVARDLTGLVEEISSFPVPR